MPSRTRHRGFTLLELMVVLTILALIAAMVVPRALGGRGREFQFTVDQVSDMLTMFAQRASLADTAVGLRYDEERHELSLASLRRRDITSGEPVWAPDVTVRPIRLPQWMLAPVLMADGEVVDTRRRPLTTEPGQPRPSVEVRLAAEEHDATIVLRPHAISPIRTGYDADDDSAPESIDLDDVGLSTEDW